MAPLDQLFVLEIEFHRRLRSDAPGTVDAGSLHTSYALQSGYEQLLRRISAVTHRDIEQAAGRLILAGDARDVLAARDSITQLLSVWPYRT